MSLVEYRTKELPTVLAAYAATNDELHQLLLSPLALKYFVKKTNAETIEWLHNYRTTHGLHATTNDDDLVVLATLAATRPGPIFNYLLQLGYVKQWIYQEKISPRDLIFSAHSDNIGWLQIQSRYTNIEILSFLPQLLRHENGDQTTIVKWLRSLPRDELIGEMPKLSDFTESYIINYVCRNDFAMLDWLVEQGADPNTWGLVFASAMVRNCCEPVLQWFDKNTHFVVRPELLLCSARRIIIHSDNFWTLTPPATRPYWLWVLINNSRIKLTAHRYRTLVVRENCMAYGGRVLRAIAAKKSRTHWWRSLARQCQLTPSDFASVGLVWPY